MHANVYLIIVFVVSLYAALAVGVLVNAYRQDRLRRMVMERLNWRGTTQAEIEQPGFRTRFGRPSGMDFPRTGDDTDPGQPGWTDVQIEAMESRFKIDGGSKLFNKQLRDHVSLPVEPREQFEEGKSAAMLMPLYNDYPPVDGLVSMLADEDETERERRR